MPQLSCCKCGLSMTRQAVWLFGKAPSRLTQGKRHLSLPNKIATTRWTAYLVASIISKAACRQLIYNLENGETHYIVKPSRLTKLGYYLFGLEPILARSSAFQGLDGWSIAKETSYKM